MSLNRGMSATILKAHQLRISLRRIRSGNHAENPAGARPCPDESNKRQLRLVLASAGGSALYLSAASLTGTYREVLTTRSAIAP